MDQPIWVPRADGLPPVLCKDENEMHFVTKGFWPQKRVGVYYYGGWYPQPLHPFNGAWRDTVIGPWAVFSSTFPERMPVRGWYNELLQATMDMNLADMAEAGVDYVLYNVYWDAANKTAPGSPAITNHMASTKNPGVKFMAGFESTSTEVPVRAGATAKQDFYDFCEYVKTLFQHPMYERREDGRPMMSILKGYHLTEVVAVRLGMTTKQVLDEFRERTGENIYFIFTGDFTSYWLNTAKVGGYDCWSHYNIFFTYTNRDTSAQGPSAKTWDELMAAYIAEWDGFLRLDRGLDYLLPMTYGWASQPWNPASTALMMPTMPQLEAGLLEAFRRIHSNPKIIGGVGYAWNEVGEGGYLQPCQQYGRRKLSIHRKVMKRR